MPPCQRDTCFQRVAEHELYQHGKNGSYLCDKHWVELVYSVQQVVKDWSQKLQYSSHTPNMTVRREEEEEN